MRATWSVARPDRMLLQPGGLPQGSRGSARRARTPASRDRIVSTPEGCQNPRVQIDAQARLTPFIAPKTDVEGFLVCLDWFGNAEALSPLRGEIIFSWRTGGRSSALRPPATFWQPSGLRRP